jgi:hypothetical protein
MAGKENYTQSDRDQIERIRRLAEENDRLKAIQRRQEVDIAELVAVRNMMADRLAREKAAHERRMEADREAAQANATADNAAKSDKDKPDNKKIERHRHYYECP